MVQKPRPSQQTQQTSSAETGLRKRTSKGIPGLLVQAALVSLPSAKEKTWLEDELLDTVYWTRQFLALVSGLVWGCIPLTGLWAFLGFLTLVNLATIMFINMQQVDIDEVGGTMLYMEGLPPAIATFLLFWIGTYTAVYSEGS